MTDQATKRPWTQGVGGNIVANGEIVAVCQSYHCDEWEANAALICEAVNASDGLLAECENLRGFATWVIAHSTDARAVDRAEAALSRGKWA